MRIDGVDLNATNLRGRTPFDFACSKSLLTVVQAMVDEPKGRIDFNRKKYGGFTGFLSACYNNHIEVVKMIVENSQKLGIDLNVQDSDGYSGLMRACHEENEEVV